MKHFQPIFKFAPQRTQSNTWVWEYQHDKLRKLSKRTEHMTGLKVENQEEVMVTSEPYQVNKKIAFFKRKKHILV